MGDLGSGDTIKGFMSSLYEVLIRYELGWSVALELDPGHSQLSRGGGE